MKAHRSMSISAIILPAAVLGLVGCGGPHGTSHQPDGATEQSHEHAVHWGYSATDGPALWSELSSEWALCGAGQAQSPIDLTGAVSADELDTTSAFKPSALRIIRHEHVVDVLNNGHTIQVNYDEGSILTVGETRYELLQFHFHAPSEHTVDGAHYPMEMHLVHKAADGGLAVIGVLIESGEHNAAFDPIWSNLPSAPSSEKHLENVAVNVDDLLPETNEVWRYRGSLTTPPCSEGVEWLVGRQIVQLSAEQIDAFTALYQHNNRPVQALHDRQLVLAGVTPEN